MTVPFTFWMVILPYAELLDIDIGAPIMRYKRTAKDKSGKVMEFTVSIYRADLYQFVIYYQSSQQDDSQGGETI